MPLGLELAATWIRLLTCAEIAHELEQGIDFLTASHRNVPARHQSIRAVFDYSWNLLSPNERQLLSKLSIFRGGFTRAAAQNISGRATLHRLGSLVDKSFVRPAQFGRHSIHELIRQYAADALNADPEQQQTTAARHSAYFLQFMAEHEAILSSSVPACRRFALFFPFVLAETTRRCKRSPQPSRFCVSTQTKTPWLMRYGHTERCVGLRANLPLEPRLCAKR
jgi:predicted ATPase